MKINRLMLAGALSAGAAATLWTASAYYEEKSAQLARLRSGSRVINTPVGLLEFASQGEGPPVLVIHGGGGGYDQGMVLADFVGEGFRWIAPSRFGYLRTPMPADASPQAQADVYANLLDYLELPAASILGFSAGGPSALQFALRHPERCQSLGLFSAINQPLPRWILNYFHRLKGLLEITPDFGVWLALKTIGPSSISWVVHTLEVNDNCDTDLIRDLQNACLPLSQRAAGTINDLSKTATGILLEEVTVPTLVIHGTADNLVPFSQGQAAADRIPGAEFKPLQGGSHIWMATHKDETKPVIRTFLNQHA